MTKLISGKKKVIGPVAAQSVTGRYDFVDLGLSEPNLGTGTTGHVLSYDPASPGHRKWIPPAAQGADGNQGVQGVQGIQGIQGLQGLQGLKGEAGQAGQSVTGGQGPQGVQGVQGIQGLKGEAGQAGQSVTGGQGPQGVQGIQGIQGIQGNQGIAGQAQASSQGLQGVQGVQGIQGLQGLQGVQGIQGVSIQGATGIQGSGGIQGSTGIQGSAGTGGGGGGDVVPVPAAAGRVAVFSGATTITGYPTFTFNNTTGTVTSVDYNSTSDRKLKTNIKNIENPIDIINKLNGVTFKWINQTDSVQHIGFIAQEVESVIPSAVSVDLGGYLAVSYDKLVPVLLEAIKELNERIKVLESK
jgi:hypothetical protein